MIDAGAFVPPKCPDDGGVGAPTGTPPALVAGKWQDISPPGMVFGTSGTSYVFTQGMALDPCNPYTIYVTVSGFDTKSFATVPGGLFRSTDGGSTWARVGAFDQPLNIRVDPRDPRHLYVGDGVRGATMGFWVSTDGGMTWTMPDGFKNISQQINDTDVYHVAPDPADFNHVLVSFHWYWHTGNDFGFGPLNAGVLESTDGGNTWVVHNPNAGWAGAGGFDVFFLYNPALGIGDKNTWLFGTQGQGFWRTTDGGNSWTRVTMQNMQHGGGTIYYAKSGVLYASGTPTVMKSMDNGVTWTPIGPGTGYTAIGGDGKYLYTAPMYGPQLPNNGGEGFETYQSALESNDTVWNDFGSADFHEGPFEMAFDSAHGILYSASWGAGLRALKVMP